MARNKPKKRDLEGEPGGLSHNPFAALRGKAELPAEGSAESPAKSPSKQREAPPVPGSNKPKGGVPSPEKLVVRKERTGRGGRTITRISGWSSDQQDLTEIARNLKRSLGCGAAVEADDLCVQGDLVERVAVYLEQHFSSRVVRGN